MENSLRDRAGGMSDRFIGIGLAIGFLALILIVAAVGRMGLDGMAKLHAEQQAIREEEWGDVDLADEALAYSNHNDEIYMELPTISDARTIASLLTERDANHEKISRIFEHLKTRVGSAREQQLLDNVTACREALVASHMHAVDLYLKQNNRKAAQKWLLEQSAPRMVKYQLAWSQFISFQVDEMNQRLDQSQRLYRRNRTKTWYLLIAGVGLAFGIAGVVAAKIMREMNRRKAAEQQIRRMNEALELKVLQRTTALETSREEIRKQMMEREAAEEEVREKNALLEAQLNCSVDGVLVVDTNHRKTVQNRRFVEIFHLPPEVVADPDKQSTTNYVMGQVADPEAYQRMLTDLYSRPEACHQDEMELRDGTVVDIDSAPVMDHAGKYYGRIWVFRDITKRKRNEEQIRRLSLAVEQSPVSVVITDLRGNIVYVNRKFTEITGYSPEEVIGKNPRILKSGHTSKQEYQQLWQTITTGRQWRGEFRNRKKNGEFYWEHALITPILDDKKTISHFMALKEDVTERRMIEAQLQRAQKLEGIGQLAAGIAHEINTPMQFIGDNTRFVQEAWRTLDELLSLTCSLMQSTAEETNPKTRLADYDVGEIKLLQKDVPAAIEESLEGVERVSRIVRAMREFSHHGPEEKQPADINHAIETTLTVARNEWKYLADVETAFSPHVGMVPCHAGEFNQVILNLIVNAAHAIAEKSAHGGEGKGKITIRTERKPDCVEISIQDTGCGIAPEIRPHIFELFFTTKDVGKGTGQGLALAHSVIVKKHGGSIWFESETGKGTTFFVRLPA